MKLSIIIPCKNEEGNIVGIYPLPANKVTATTDEDGTVYYIYGEFVFEESEILKVVNFYDRGIIGNSLIDYQKNTFAHHPG